MCGLHVFGEDGSGHDFRALCTAVAVVCGDDVGGEVDEGGGAVGALVGQSWGADVGDR